MDTLTQGKEEQHERVVARWLDFVNNATGCGSITEMWAPNCVVHPGGGLPEVRLMSQLGAPP